MDAFFLAHLRDLYREPDTIVKVDHGRGGSSKTVALAAIKAASLADYSAVLILLDSDRNEEDVPTAWRKQNNLIVKRSNPCLESLLLEILGDDKWSTLRNGAQASGRCKSRFQSEYLKTDRSTEAAARFRAFIHARMTREALDEAAARIPVLDEIIHAIRTGMG